MQPRIMPCSFIAVYTLALLLLLVEVSGFVPAACRWAVDKANARSGYSSPAGVAAGEGVGWVLHAKATGGERRRMDVIDYSNCNILGDSSSRSDMLRSLGLAGSAMVFGQALSGRPGPASAEEDLPTVGKITKNGVKYFEYRVGSGEAPRWGQACVVRFVLYGRPKADANLLKIDASDNNGEPYLFKHGNGRQIKGMEEGLHSMRVGGKRRVIIPREMGYTVQGLGPYPANARNRDALVKVLKSFENSPGELVMDVELLDVFDDEADQGYYEDETPNLEELQQIISDTGRFSTSSFERLPGQVAFSTEDVVGATGDSPPEIGK